jgi:hypothetical protein
MVHRAPLFIEPRNECFARCHSRTLMFCHLHMHPYRTLREVLNDSAKGIHTIETRMPHRHNFGIWHCRQ